MRRRGQGCSKKVDVYADRVFGEVVEDVVTLTGPRRMDRDRISGKKDAGSKTNERPEMSDASTK